MATVEANRGTGQNVVNPLWNRIKTFALADKWKGDDVEIAKALRAGDWTRAWEAAHLFRKAVYLGAVSVALAACARFLPETKGPTNNEAIPGKIGLISADLNDPLLASQLLIVKQQSNSPDCKPGIVTVSTDIRGVGETLGVCDLGENGLSLVVRQQTGEDPIVINEQILGYVQSNGDIALGYGETSNTDATPLLVQLSSGQVLFYLSDGTTVIVAQSDIPEGMSLWIDGFGPSVAEAAEPSATPALATATATEPPATSTAEPKPSATPTVTTPASTEVVSQTVKLEYEVPSAPEFGGFTVDLGLTASGKRMGFVEPVSGPRTMYEQVLWAIIYQSGGKYGTNIAEIQSYLQKNGGIIPDFTLYQIADNSSSRVPPYIEPAPSVELDLSQGIVIQRASIPPVGCTAVHLSDSRLFSCLGVSPEGQLVFTDDSEYLLLDSISSAPVSRFYTLLEAVADIKNVNKYPHTRPNDYFMVAIADWLDVIVRNEDPEIIRLDARSFMYKDDQGKVWSIIAPLP